MRFLLYKFVSYAVCIIGVGVAIAWASRADATLGDIAVALVLACCCLWKFAELRQEEVDDGNPDC